jgi:hypothetical protein
MQMPSISIFAVGSAVIAPLAVFLRYLLKRPLKVASTSEELLDLFEDRCALLEDDATPPSPNDEGPASEHFTAGAAGNLTPVSAPPTELPTSAETCPVYRIEAAPGLSIPGVAGGAIAFLAGCRSYISRRAHLVQARLAKARLAHLHQPQLGAYEKARVERYLNEVHAGRMTCEEAQLAIASEWIAAYQPIMHGRALHSR